MVHLDWEGTQPSHESLAGRNAPSPRCRYSRLIDHISEEIAEARARGLYPDADELQRARQIVVETVRSRWRKEGVGL